MIQCVVCILPACFLPPDRIDFVPCAGGRKEKRRRDCGCGMQQRGWLAVREKRESYAGWRRRKERKEEGKKEKEICSQLRVNQAGNIFAYIEAEKGGKRRFPLP